MNSRKIVRKARQAGLTLVEVLLALAIVGTATIAFTQLADRFGSDVSNNGTAEYMRHFGDATSRYTDDNYSALAGTATATQPVLITNSMLVSTGYLTGGGNGKNNRQQDVCALVLQPTPGTLQTLVVSEGGATIDDVTLGEIAGLIGASGGSVNTQDPSNISGTGGGWKIPLTTFNGLTNNLGKHCDGTTAGAVQLTAGHNVVSLWLDKAPKSNALYRNAVPGMPELNTMNTPLIMNSVQTANSACSTPGAVANDGAGALLNCTGGLWQPVHNVYWGDPAANYASLGACTATQKGLTRVVNTPTVGSGPRAYTCDGAAWQPLATNDQGNLTLPGTLATGKVQINDTVTANAACTPNGLLGKDTTGQLLACVSGAWKVTGGSDPATGLTWQNVTGARCNGCWVQNTTGRSIYAAATGNCCGNSDSHVYINGSEVSREIAQWNGGAGWGSTGMWLIPPGATYTFYFYNGLAMWWELR